MSSNSSRDRAGRVPAETIEALLTAAIEILAVELPEGFTNFVRRGRGLVIRIQVDDEVFLVDFSPPGSVGLLPAPTETARGDGAGRGSGDVRVSSTRSAVAEVLSGRSTITELVGGDRLAIVGSLEEVSQLHDTLIAFMEGAVRCDSMPKVLNRLGNTPPDTPA